MRYAPKQWGPVAILMRDSTYSVLDALSKKAMGWTELKDATELSHGGLQKVLKEMIKMGLVGEQLVKKSSGFGGKKYSLTPKARKERIYEKAKELKASLERLMARD